MMTPADNGEADGALDLKAEAGGKATEHAIAYSDGYKYRLELAYLGQYPTFRPPEPIQTAWFALDTAGRVLARLGYAWDGPSGPTLDTDVIRRPSLHHDIGYQCLRLGLVPTEVYVDGRPVSVRKILDQDYRTMALEDLDRIAAARWGWFKRNIWRHLGKLRIQAHYLALRAGGASSADPRNARKIQWSPLRPGEI